MVAETLPVDRQDSSLNLLVVEDNVADSKLLITFLKEVDGPLVAHLVTDGEEAVRYLMRRGEHSQAPTPDAILLDINLPKKNGFEVLAEIRQDSRVSSIPVFVISSTKNPEDVRRGQALNVAGFFTKPADIQDYEKLAAILAFEEFPKYIPGKFPLAHGSGGVSESVKPMANKMMQTGDAVFRQLVDAVKDYAIYMLDLQGNILTWNEGAEYLQGYRPYEVIGKHYSIFYTEEARRNYQPTQELEIATRSVRFQGEGWRVKKDGSRFWGNVNMTAIRDKGGELIGYVNITRDFSEHKEAERKLRESERRFRILVQQIKDYAIFMLTPEGIIASWNSGAERIKGYRASEIIGKHFSVFYTQEALDKNHPAHELKIAIEKGVYEEEGLRVKKDGSTFWANVVITALYDEEGVLQGFSKVTRDISERKRGEEEKQKLAERLEIQVKERTQQLEISEKQLIQQRDQLIRSNTDLQQFAYIASHDLQEPLRGIVSCLQLIEKRYAADLKPEAQEYMDLAVESSRRMRALIEGLLQYGRVGQVAQSPGRLDLNQVLKEILVTLNPAIAESNASIQIEKLPIVHVDPSQITQVFQNLLTNAIKYRSDQPLKIEIGVEKGNGEWIFSIKDNGIGIAPQYFERIFVMFQRLHSNREKYPGTGIGLAICKRIIETHGGKIWVVSEPGSGSTFYFTLPIQL